MSTQQHKTSGDIPFAQWPAAVRAAFERRYSNNDPSDRRPMRDCVARAIWRGKQRAKRKAQERNTGLPVLRNEGLLAHLGGLFDMFDAPHIKPTMPIWISHTPPSALRGKRIATSDSSQP
jgi:hypothetical protein